MDTVTIAKKLRSVRTICFVLLVWSCLALMLKPGNIYLIVFALTYAAFIWLRGKNRENILSICLIIYTLFPQYLFENYTNFYSAMNEYILAAIKIAILLIFLLNSFGKIKTKAAKSWMIAMAIAIIATGLLAVFNVFIDSGLFSVYNPSEIIMLIIILCIVLSAAFFVQVFLPYIMYQSLDPAFYNAFFKENPDVLLIDTGKTRKKGKLQKYDCVKLLTDKYIADGVKMGDIGYIFEINSRNCNVYFKDSNDKMIAAIVMPRSEVEGV